MHKQSFVVKLWENFDHPS